MKWYVWISFILVFAISDSFSSPQFPQSAERPSFPSSPQKNSTGGLELDYIMASKDEMEALSKFRKMVSPYLSNNNYYKEDIYLIKWLRAKDLNLEEAKSMLLDNLKWRKEHNIDTITSETWNDLKDDYVYKNDGYDKQGRPVGTVNLGQWNVLVAAISGKMPRLIRYMTNLLELSAQQVRDLQYQGKNVTQFTLIMNLEGFNGIEHTCPVCFPLYTSFVETTQNYYTGYPYRVFLINTPVVFKTVLDIIQPLFTPGTKRILKIYGSDKTQWQPVLDNLIDRDQRRPEFGGTRKD